MENRKPWGFCETPEEKCTLNYCDENGCQNRKRNYVEGKDLIADVVSSEAKLLPIHDVVGQSEQLICPVCKSSRIKKDPKWEDNECLNCGKIWTT